MKLYTQRVADKLSSLELHEAAHALLREALARDFGIRPFVLQKGVYGKPYLALENAPQISLSHTDGLVCCAVSDQTIGVDCERIHTVQLRVAKRVCTPAELQRILSAEDPCACFLQYWTLKESISKKLGVGMTQSFQNYEISFEHGKPYCAGHRLQLLKKDGFFIAMAE